MTDHTHDEIERLVSLRREFREKVGSLTTNRYDHTRAVAKGAWEEAAKAVERRIIQALGGTWGENE